MINWYDIQVEEKIAQERYQTLIQARQIEKIAPANKKESLKPRLFRWLGRHLVGLGYYLQQDQQAATRSQC